MRACRVGGTVGTTPVVERSVNHPAARIKNSESGAVQVVIKDANIVGLGSNEDVDVLAAYRILVDRGGKRRGIHRLVAEQRDADSLRFAWLGAITADDVAHDHIAI